MLIVLVMPLCICVQLFKCLICLFALLVSSVAVLVDFVLMCCLVFRVGFCSVSRLVGVPIGLL